MGYWNYKKPKTSNERGQTQCRGDALIVDGYVVKIRASRNCKNLPNLYDEPMTFIDGRSWKRHRKTRWKTR